MEKVIRWASLPCTPGGAGGRVDCSSVNRSPEPNWPAIACEEKKRRALAEERVASLEMLVYALSLRPPIEAYEKLQAELALVKSIMHDAGVITQAHNVPTGGIMYEGKPHVTFFPGPISRQTSFPLNALKHSK